MTAIQQKVTIPADRRLSLELLVPEHIPVGSAEVLLVFRAQLIKQIVYFFKLTYEKI